MQPDGGGDAGSDGTDGTDTADIDASGAETIDRELGAAAAAAVPVPSQVTSPTRSTASRRKPRTTGGMFAATQLGQDATLDHATTDVVAPRPAPIPPGTVLAGRYHVGALVGQGGMGTVYAARDVDLDEDVALKLLRTDLARDEAYRKRLRGEVRLARRVSHPNVCRVHDFGVAGELVFVTMELVRGSTLRQLLGEMRAGRLVAFDLAQVVDVLVQVGSALTAAHRAGVIHRDVKPDNVILTDGRAVLTDFGVATRSSETADLLAGTPAYLAPEVLRQEPFDHKVDVYALAVLAYELLTGRTPFVAKTIEQATALVALRPPYPPLPEQLAGPELRRALDKVLARGLAPDPLLRTPAVDRFTEAFAFAARGAPGTVAGVMPRPGSPRTAEGSDVRPPASAVIAEATPTGERDRSRPGSAGDAGSTSATTPVRRPEVRVATALAWRRDDDEPTGGNPRPAGRAAGGPTPLDSASLVEPTGGNPRPAGGAVRGPTPLDSASLVEPTGGNPRPAGRAARGPTPLDSASLVEALAAAEAAERIVVDAGGTPIRVAPGEVIALFGATRSTGDDADRATRAALDAVRALGGRAGLDTTRILLRPGVAEPVGPEAALGAAAIAAGAGVGEVVVSTAAARQLVARFDLAPPDPRAIGRPVRRVLGVRAGEAAPAIQTFRARELAALDAHLERAFRERIPVVIEVRGGAGSGKTRLREALVASAGARREIDWLIAVGSPVGSPAPLSTLAAASRDWYDATTGGGAITDPARRHNAARRWLETRATRRPTAVIIEDVQWTDPSTRAVLEHLRVGLDDVPVAIVTFARSDDGPAPELPPGVEVISLGPLDDVAAARLVRSVAPGASPDSIKGVVARGAGNPFFIEELARELADGGTTLPASIEAVIQARLDHLPEIASQVALAAAVIGRAFWRSAVAALVPLDGPALDAALAELERRGVVTATAPVTLEDDRYQFTQGLVRDVAYARIPPRERREHHAAIAAWLDARAAAERPRLADAATGPAPARPDDIALLLDATYHREQSGDTAGAASAYRRAGTRCLEVFAYGEAANALRRSLALAPTADFTVHEDLGDALAETDGPAAAEAAYRAAAQVLPGDDLASAARLAYKLGLSATRRGDTATAIERYRGGLALVAPDGEHLVAWAHADPRTAARLLGGLGWTLGYQLARVDDGHPLCERAVALLEGTPYRRDLAHALSRLGGTYMRACRFADQLSTNERNLEISLELGDLNMQLTAHINLGVVHGLLGAIAEAVTETVAARALAARLGAAASGGLAASNLAGLLIEEGRLDEAEVALDEALDLIERTGHRYVLCETYAFYARLAAARGDLIAARTHAERSRGLATELGSPLDGAVATRLLAQIAARSGNHAEARRLIDTALAAAVAADAFEAARTRAARARVLAAAGDPEAAAATGDARAELAALGAMRELEVLEDLGEVR